MKVKSHCVLFPDDATLFKNLENLRDFEELQDDLFELCRWASKWLLFFNVLKCKLMHIGKHGKGNPNFIYDLKYRLDNTNELKTVKSEKDLGITFQQNLKFDEHIRNVVNKANRLLGLVKISFSYIETTSFLTIYETIIRPIIDYGDSVLNPSLKKHIQIIENIQRRGTKLVPDIAHLSNIDRLRESTHTILQTQKRRFNTGF